MENQGNYTLTKIYYNKLLKELKKLGKQEEAKRCYKRIQQLGKINKTPPTNLNQRTEVNNILLRSSKNIETKKPNEIKASKFIKEARILENQKDYDKAILSCEKAIKLNSKPNYIKKLKELKEKQAKHVSYREIIKKQRSKLKDRIKQKEDPYKIERQKAIQHYQKAKYLEKKRITQISKSRISKSN